MRTQDYLADNTIFTAEAIIREVERLGDKATWAPLDEGRTALDQLSECAIITARLPSILATYSFPDFTPEDYAQFLQEKASLDSTPKAAAKLREAAQAAAAAIRAIPDEDLSKTMKFWGENPWPIANVAAYPAWNHTYHHGQVCYIQTLAGDKEMVM